MHHSEWPCFFLQMSSAINPFRRSPMPEQRQESPGWPEGNAAAGLQIRNCCRQLDANAELQWVTNQDLSCPKDDVIFVQKGTCTIQPFVTPVCGFLTKT